MAPAMSDCTRDDHDFLIGNRPEGLNVVASQGPPSAWKGQLSHLSLKQDVEQFGLAGKIWQAYVRMICIYIYVHSLYKDYSNKNLFT